VFVLIRACIVIPCRKLCRESAPLACACSDQRLMRQGERSLQLFSAAAAQLVLLSLWQALHAFGIFSCSVSAGVTKWKVWLRTFTSAIVCSIFGIWQATHSLPVLPSLWCVCSSIDAACGPFCVLGP